MFAALGLTLSALVLTLSGLVASTMSLFNLALDLAVGRVRCLEGQTSASYATEGHGPGWTIADKHYWYVVQDEYVSVTADEYLALRPYSGSTCRVHIAPHSKLLLSLESIKVRHVDDFASND